MDAKTAKRVGKGTKTNVPKRKREIDDTVLNAFWHLSDLTAERRLQGAQAILTALSTKQHDDQERCKELDYIIKRLIRGLASSRKCARHGYSAVLTSVLRKYPLYSVSEMLQLVNEHLKVMKSEAKSEVSGTLIGRIVAYLCIVQSEHIKKADEDELSNLVRAILTIRKRKAVLRPICSETLAQLIGKVEKDVFKKVILPQIQSELTTGWSNCSADALLLLAVAYKCKHIGKAFLSEHFDCKKFMTLGNIEHFVQIIAQAAVLYPVIHPVSIELLSLALNKEVEFFSTFWERVVCDGLMKHGSTKFQLGLSLAVRLFDSIQTPDQVKAVLSAKFLSCIIHQTSSKHQQTVKSVKQMLQSLVGFVENSKSADTQMAVLTALISPPSSIHFDSLTKTKTVSTIVGKLNSEGCQLLCDYLLQVMRGTDKDPQTTEATAGATDANRKWALSTLSNLVTHPGLPVDSKWQLFIIQFVFVNAFFEVHRSVTTIQHLDQQFSSACSSELRVDLQTAFFRMLNKVATFNPSKDKQSHNYRGFANLLNAIVEYAQVLLTAENTGTVKCLTQFTDEVQQSWADMMKVVQSLRQKTRNDGSESKFSLAFELLFLHSGLQLFVEPTTAVDVLQELQVCYKKAARKKRQSKSTDEDDTNLDWVDVVVDLLMSLLSSDRHLVRTVANSVIVMLTPHLTMNSLQLMIDVLKTNTNEDGILGFDDEEDGEEDEEEDMEEAEEHDESVAENGKSSSSESGNSSSEDEDTDDEEEDMDVDAGLAEKVKTALGDAAAHSDEEESDLDDEAMFRLDGVLSAAFQSMKRGSKVDKEKELQVKHYKMRCLDFIEQIIKHTKCAGKLTFLIKPLLDLTILGYQRKDASELGSRAQRVLSELCQTKQVTSDDVKAESLQTMLTELVQQASKVTHMGKEPSNVIASAFLFVLRVAIDLDTRLTGEDQSSNVNSAIRSAVLDVLKNQVEDFCHGRNNVNHFFLQKLFEKRPDVLWSLMETLVEFSTNADTRVFCKTQVSVWLMTIVNRHVMQLMEPERWTAVCNNAVSRISQIVLQTEVEQLKPLYTAHLLNILLRMLSTDANVKALFKEDVMLALPEKLSALRKVNQELRLACNRLSGVLQIKLPSATSQKSEEKQQTNKKRHLEEQVAANDGSNDAAGKTVVAKKNKKSAKSADATSKKAKKGKKSVEVQRKENDVEQEVPSERTESETGSSKKKRKLT